MPGLRALYVDDVEVIYLALAQKCDTVAMGSDEYTDITMDNITEAKTGRLTRFTFRGAKPEVTVTIGTTNRSELRVAGNFEEIDPLYQRLLKLLNELRRWHLD